MCESDWTYNTFDQYDFILTEEGWKNACRNIESDPDTILGSDHMPVVVDFKVRFKKPDKSKYGESGKCLEVDEYTKDELNAKIDEYFEYLERNNSEGGGIEVMDKALERAAAETLQEKTPKPRKPWVSEATLKLITEKHAMDRRGDSENFNNKEKKSGGN